MLRMRDFMYIWLFINKFVFSKKFYLLVLMALCYFCF